MGEYACRDVGMRRRMLLFVGIAGAVVVVVAAVVTITGGKGSCVPSWHVVAHEGVPPLSAVVAFSPTDVWAVEGAEGGISRPPVAKPVIVHWDGRTLRTKTFPWQDAVFRGIAGASRRDVWAVGVDGSVPLAVHWDGRRWQRAQLPSTNRAKYGGLDDVAAVAADDVWAVGSGGVGERPLVMHWNGKRWQTLDMHAVAPHGSELYAIEAASAHEVWAVGAQNLDASSENGFWDLVLRWDGRRWREVPSPLSDEEGTGPSTNSVSISPSGEVWAGSSGYNGPYFVRWSGPTHATTHFYDWDISGNSVNDIAAVAANDVWAVGEIDYGEDLGRPDHTPLVGHWNGKGWKPERTPFDTLKNQGGADTNRGLEGIFALSPHDIWAVGDRLIVRYSCS